MNQGFSIPRTSVASILYRLSGILSLIFIITTSDAQTVFWTETFDGAVCAAGSGCDPTLVSWTTTNTGTNGTKANKFYVSCRENGNAVGACGSGCGANQTLHLGNVSTSSAAALFCPTGDCGAAYDASGNQEVTNKRCQSPTVSCAGFSGISCAFKYIENGDGTNDNATFWYFNGSAWSQLNDMAKTATGCGGQGIWTLATVNLPASANNNPNVRVGFNWTNNGDGSGSDPSFAVNDVQLRYTTPLPIELVTFEAVKSGNSVRLLWTTSSEMNNDYFTVERSIDAINFEPVLYRDGAGNSNHRINYVDIDNNPLNGKSYYRLKQTDFDGESSYSGLVVVDFSNELNDLVIYPNPSTGEFTFSTVNPDEKLINVIIYDTKGSIVHNTGFTGSVLKIDLSDLPEGIYFAEATSEGLISRKKIIISR